MSIEFYDYAIVGAGAAGLNLALAMQRDQYFNDKSILIIEKEDKDVNDKTWCFWEKGKSNWDKLTAHQFKKSEFITNKKRLVFELDPYRYKMIHSKDFYSYTRNKLQNSPQIYWVKDEIFDIEEGVHCLLTGKSGTYKCSHTFDSRIDPQFQEQKDDYFRVIQHFKGWFIKTKEEIFDPGTFTMMDFRIKHGKSTSFTYVLPKSKNEALIEFTLFTPTLISDKEYDKYLKRYINNILKIEDYEITEEEKGIIPMSDYPFHQHHKPHITKIGTAGGWVRPSSGYSFKSAQLNSQQIIRNIKLGQDPSRGIAKSRFRKYDTLFLDLLENKNHLGEKLFSSMYQKNDIKTIFKFLDEKTTLYTDLQIVSGFPWKPFAKSLLKNMKRVTS